MLVSHVSSALQIKDTNLILHTSEAARRAWQHLPKTCGVPGL